MMMGEKAADSAQSDCDRRVVSNFIKMFNYSKQERVDDHELMTTFATVAAIRVNERTRDG